MKHIHSLRARVILYFTLLVVIVSAAISFVVGAEYRRSRLTQYADLAFSYANAAADYIDGDRVQCYLEGTPPDEYYQQVSDYLMTQLNHSTVMDYYYVCVLRGGTAYYIWDLDLDYIGYPEKTTASDRKLFDNILGEKSASDIYLTNTDEYGPLASAYVPIFDSNGEVSAIAGVDISVEDINRKIGMFVAEITASVLLISIIAVVIIYQNIRRRIITPINTLHAATDNIVEQIESGQPFHVGIHTGDEIENLAHAFESMDTKLRTYIDELSAVTAERERISAELDVARQIQTSLLPNSFPSRPEFEIYASMTPAKEVGGDFFDYFMPDDTHVAIVVADVSGKGLPASLFAVVAKTLIKDHTQAGSDPGSIFTTVNRLLCESNSENMFVTAFEGVLDLVSGEFRFVNAGHELPFIYRNGIGYQAYQIDSGFVLGGLETMTYQSGVIQLEPGDKIFQYTDGVTEATTGKEAYGMSRLKTALNRGAALSPTQLLPFIKSDIDTFAGSAAQFDDITMLCLSYKARPTDS